MPLHGTGIYEQSHMKFFEDRVIGAADFPHVLFNGLLDGLDAGHDCGVVAGEDFADFHIGELQLAAAKEHGHLARQHAVAGLGFAQDIF